MESPSTCTICEGSRKTFNTSDFCLFVWWTCANRLFGAHQNVWPILTLEVQVIVMGQGLTHLLISTVTLARSDVIPFQTINLNRTGILLYILIPKTFSPPSFTVKSCVMLLSTSYLTVYLSQSVIHLQFHTGFSPTKGSSTWKVYPPPLWLLLLSNWPTIPKLEVLAFFDLLMYNGGLLPPCSLNHALHPLSGSQPLLSSLSNLCHPNHWSQYLHTPSQWCAGKDLKARSTFMSLLYTHQHRRRAIIKK